MEHLDIIAVQTMQKIKQQKLDLTINAVQQLNAILIAAKYAKGPVVLNGRKICKDSWAGLIDLVYNKLFTIKWCGDFLSNQSEELLVGSAIALFVYPSEEIKLIFPELCGLQSIEISTPLPIHQFIVERARKRSCTHQNRFSGLSLDSAARKGASGGEIVKFLDKDAPYFS